MSPRRRWPRRLAVVVAALVVLALALRLAISSYAERRLERAREAYRQAIGPLDLGRLELPEAPDEQNAASWIGRAAAANDAVPSDDRLGRLAATPSSSWTDVDVEAARRLLAEREEALGLLSRARMAGSSTYGIRYREGFNAVLPDLLALVRVAKLEGVVGRLAIVEGSSSGFTESVETLLAVADSLCRESTLVTLLIGSAADRLALTLMSERLAAGELAELDLEGLLRAVADRCCGEEALRRALSGEAMMIDTAPGAEAAMGAEPSWPWRVLDWAFRRPTAALMPAATLEVRRRQLENLGLPFSEYRARWEAGEFYPDAVARKLDFVGPNLIEAIGKLKAGETAAALARAALTVALEHRRTGRFPESLSLSATPYAAEVPGYARSERAAEIVAPHSAALWQGLHPESRDLQAFPPAFRWRIVP